MFELVGTVSASPGREVTSATIDVGDGMARALTLTPTMWRVTVPLPASIEGTRTFTLSITDQSGQTTSATVQVLIDTRGPQVALTTPTSTTVVGASVMLSGTVADASLPPASFSIAGGSANVNATVTGTTWTATVAFPANIDRLARTLTWTAADTRGNSSTGTFSLLVDTQPPALALTSPAPNVAVGRMATLSGTATDSSGPPSNVTIDLGAGPTPLTVVSGAWTTQATFPMNLDRVMRTVTLRGTDAVGNQASVTAMVLVDTQGPTLTFTSPAAGERLGVPAMQVVTGAASDSTALMGVTLNCGDSGGNRTATISAGTWSVTWPLPTADNTSFTCTATATDSLGNVTTLTRSFFVDTVAPVVAFTVPASGAIVGGPAQTMLVVAGTVSDGSPVSPLQVTFNAATNMATPTGTTWSTGFTLPAVDYVSTPISVTATDAEGNATTIMRSVFVDRVAPVVTMTAPNAGQVFNIASFGGGSTVNVTWTVTDGDPTRTVQSFNGTTTGPTSGTIGTNASDNGVQYTATVTVADRAGNVSSPASRTFTVDRVAPTVVSTSPANGTVRNASRTATVIFSEPLNATVPALAGVGSGAWSAGNTRWDSAQLASSTTYLASVASGLADLAGNPLVSTASWRFRTSVLLPVGFPGPHVTLASNVASFDATNDADGQFFVVYRGTGGNPQISTLALNGVTSGTVTNPAGLSLFAAAWDSDVHAQIWSAHVGDLSLVRHRSINAGIGASVYGRVSYADAAAVDPVGIPVLTPPLFPAFPFPLGPGGGEPDGTDPFGLISGTTYTRYPHSSTLLRAPRKVIPGAEHWAALSLNATSLARAHRYCGPLSGPFLLNSCFFDQGSFANVPANVMSSLTGGVSDSNCLMYAFDTNAGRRVFAGNPGTTDFTPATPPSGSSSNFVISTRLAGGHWGAASNGAVVSLYRTTNPADCTTTSIPFNWTYVGDLSAVGATSIRVVDLGTTVGVIYLHSPSNELRLVYQ